MFTDFLYLLRSYGMKTSLNEWNSLMDALEMNLNDASLTEFYYMARAVLVKKESEYDKFDHFWHILKMCRRLRNFRRRS
mgnify:CR=1 FL=1